MRSLFPYYEDKYYGVGVAAVVSEMIIVAVVERR
jgi:hypothetical protein